MHKLEYVLENKMHKIFCDFEIQTGHLIQARKPDLEIINKKERICRIEDFAVPADHRVKIKENEKRNKYLDLAERKKKVMETRR